MITFTDHLPAPAGHSTLNRQRAQELLDACIDNPNQWAKVPITWLYEDLEGAPADKVKRRCRDFTGRVKTGHIAIFKPYNVDAATRGANAYVRINISKRELKDLY